MFTRLKFRTLFKYLNRFIFLEKSKGFNSYLSLTPSETVDTVDLIRILRKGTLSCLVLSTFVFTDFLHADDIKANFSKVGDASHLEFSGRQTWNYNLRRVEDKDGAKLLINLPKLDAQSKAHLSAWKNPLVKSVSIGAGPDGGDEVTFALTNNVESFDYLTDQPSRFVIDFFKGQPKVASKAKPTKITKTKAATVLRTPASASVQTPVAKAGVFDAADPDYSRFNIIEADIVEDAIIASRNNIYLYFPGYNFPTPLLAEMVEAPPVYEIKPEDDDENKKARLLLTLFNKKRPAVFLKTLEFFNKQYPKSKFTEMTRYMEADIFYSFYEESKNPVDLEKAATRYQALVDQFPDSSLAERTTLLLAYSYFDRGDYINSMKFLSRFQKRFPNSKWTAQVQLTLADTHRLTNHPTDALAVLEELESNANLPEYSTVAAFKKGDIYFGLKQYGKAIVEYQKYMQKFAAQTSKFPNAHFNIAEAYFWLGQYKKSIDSHREFVRLFPKDSYGGYSLARIGELLEILGASKTKKDGAYLEAMFRYQNTEGANVAKVRLTSDRMPQMKDNQVKAALEEINAFAESSKLPRIKEFVTILVSDGYSRRQDFAAALELLVKFYKDNPTAELEVFKGRIRANIIQQLRNHVEKKEFLEVFKLYGKYVSAWLKNTDRIDIEYYLAKSFEMAGVQGEAAEYYRKVLNRLYAIQGTKEEKERRVLEDLPAAEAVNLRLAAMTVAQKDFAKAAFYIESIKSTSNLKPEEQIEKTELASVIADERGQTDLAKKYLKDLIQSWKGQPSLVSGPYLKLARLQFKNKEFEGARGNLEKILNLDSDSKQVSDETVAKTLELKGDLLIAEKKPAEAVLVYRKLLDRFEDSMSLEPVRYQLGRLQFESGNLLEAERTWSALKPDTFWAKMASEQLENSKWSQQYKKYLKRIPAMANSK